MRIYNLKFNKKRRQYLRKNMTKAEIVLWKRLKRKQLGYKFRRQYGIGKYIVDFYCPQLKLVIELDGAIHYIGNGPKKDKIRQEYLESVGLIIKRYDNNIIIKNIEDVLEEILYVCNEIGNDLKKVNPGFPPKTRGRIQRGLTRCRALIRY